MSSAMKSNVSFLSKIPKKIKNKKFITKPHTSSPFLNKIHAMFHRDLAATLKHFGQL
jgi:hypothetical protein